MRICMRNILLALAIVLFSAGVDAQENGLVQLKQVHVAYALKSFYVNDVTDSLADGTTIGTITANGKTSKLSMDGGVRGAFKNFIDHNVTQKKSTQAIDLNVTKMNIEIKKKGASYVENIAVSYKFYIAGIFSKMYYNSGQVTIDTLPEASAEQFLRDALTRDISDLDKWWAVHKNDYAVAQEVKVNVAMGKTVSMPDCIVYNIKKPLQVSDFKGPVQGGDTVRRAETTSGMVYGFTEEVKNGQKVINYTVTPYFDRATSWFNGTNNNPTLLAHEQAHFDITAIKTCELANAVKHADLTKDNYKEMLNKLYLQYTAEQNEEQAAYDKETNHSRITDKQQEWQQRIAKEVRESGCY